LDLVSRLALAANRAGYGLVCRLAPTQGASPEVETVAGWEALASRLENDSNPCTIASTELLAEAGWLKALLGCKPGLAAWAASAAIE